MFTVHILLVTVIEPHGVNVADAIQDSAMSFVMCKYAISGRQQSFCSLTFDGRPLVGDAFVVLGKLLCDLGALGVGKLEACIARDQSHQLIRPEGVLAGGIQHDRIFKITIPY